MGPRGPSRPPNYRKLPFQKSGFRMGVVHILGVQGRSKQLWRAQEAAQEPSYRKKWTQKLNRFLSLFGSILELLLEPKISQKVVQKSDQKWDQFWNARRRISGPSPTPKQLKYERGEKGKAAGNILNKRKGGI